MSELLAFLLELLLDVSGGLVQTWFGFSNGRTGWQAASSRVSFSPCWRRDLVRTSFCKIRLSQRYHVTVFERRQ